MILDLLIVPPVILTTLLGFRDGSVRKLVSILAIVGSLFVGQITMRQSGDFLVQNFGSNPDSAPSYGFLWIFLMLNVFQAVMYSVVTHKYKIGGIADRVAGCVLGFMQGVLFLSCVFMIFSLRGVPSRAFTNDSRLYKPVVNIAPRILDAITTASSEATEGLKERASPDVKPK